MQLPKTGDTLLGKYVLENALGEGGMGVVYAARHDLLGQRVAVKLIRPEYASRADTVGRFLNEARAAALIQNDHVARVLDVGTLDSGLPYMVLEYLPGSDLQRVLHERGPLPIADVADYLLQAIDAVAHAHSLGIIHRDLKPSNLFLTKRQDGTVQVKVFDFGISKIMGTTAGSAGSMTHTNAMLGSPLYMSPEQLRDSKNVDHRCDIWALGVVAYELLTGRTPFIADNAVALFAAIQENEPPSMGMLRREVSPSLEAIVMRCLRRRTDDRWASVTELAVALAPFGTPIAARALENASRILPLKETVPRRESVGTLVSASPNAGSNPGSSPPLSAPSGRAITAVGVSTSTPGIPTTTRTGVLVALSSLAIFVMLLAGGGWLVMRSRSPQVTPDAVAASPASVVPSASSLEPPAAVSIAVATAAAAPSAATPVPSAEPSAAPSALMLRPLAAPVTAGANASAHANANANANAGAIKPPVAAPSAHARPNCTPPYEFDATGKKIWKRECL